MAVSRIRRAAALLGCSAPTRYSGCSSRRGSRVPISALDLIEDRLDVARREGVAGGDPDGVQLGAWITAGLGLAGRPQRLPHPLGRGQATSLGQPLDGP